MGPSPDRCAQKIDRVKRAQEVWVFSDGYDKGASNCVHYNPVTEPFLCWFSHLEGANVAYLDGHVSWVPVTRWRDWRDNMWSQHAPGMWCTVTCWHTLWQ